MRDKYIAIDNQLNRNEKMILVIYIVQLIALVLPIAWIIAVIMSYVKCSDVRHSWLESHCRWQIRSFWFGLLWYVLGIVTSIILIGYAILFLNTVWLLYRAIKGMMYLFDRKVIAARVIVSNNNH